MGLIGATNWDGGGSEAVQYLHRGPPPIYSRSCATLTHRSGTAFGELRVTHTILPGFIRYGFPLQAKSLTSCQRLLPSSQNGFSSSVLTSKFHVTEIQYDDPKKVIFELSGNTASKRADSIGPAAHILIHV